MTPRLHVFIEGWVQGVGFRYATHAQALALGLSGWVRNLPDGRVEAEFCGPKVLLDQMLAWCRKGPRGASVRNVETSWDETDTPPAGFRIRY
ncbi:MAG TPA: acylphosphatase [Candidatus Hydrogenedentes bacterium]|nr:acylphosphatase [Candidatus Hydrogenedentota bacterium]